MEWVEVDLHVTVGSDAHLSAIAGDGTPLGAALQQATLCELEAVFKPVASGKLVQLYGKKPKESVPGGPIFNYTTGKYDDLNGRDIYDYSAENVADYIPNVGMYRQSFLVKCKKMDQFDAFAAVMEKWYSERSHYLENIRVPHPFSNERQY